MSVLGVPEEDEPFMLRLTQEFFGAKDEERNRAKVSADPLEIVKAVQQVVHDANEYFRKISGDRRRKPANDLASVIANSQIDGRPIDDLEAMGYYITIAFAGHDTTSSSIAGGIWALCERPDQLKLVQSDLSLIPALVEEAIRWTTPIHQFVRVAAETCVLRGRRVTKGNRIILCFPSGNRDEEVFEDPFAFRVDRKPNRHIGFGYGPHICLGMFLARMEMSIFFQELLPRIEWMELTGEPKGMVSNFVGGPKFVPIRIKMRR
jgi:cytochrome P450